MRAVLKELENSPCRWAVGPTTAATAATAARDVSGDSPFRNSKFLQNYWPMLNTLPLPEYASYEDCELPSKFSVTDWNRQINSKIWSGKIQTHCGGGGGDSDCSGCGGCGACSLDIQDANIFIKNCHLIDPLELLKGDLCMPECAVLPNYSPSWIRTYEKIQSRDNQAYVDCFANFLLSRLREKDITPHCILFYGAKLGISESYEYKLSDQFESIRNQKWFWNGLYRKNAQIRLDLEDDCDYSKYKFLLQDPFKVVQTENNNTVEEIEDNNNDISGNFIDNKSSCTVQVEEFNFNNIDEIQDGIIFNVNRKENSVDTAYDFDDDSEKDGSDETGTEETRTSLENSDDDASDASDASSDSNDKSNIEITLISKNIPVITILQEAHEGTLDSLLDLDEIDGIQADSSEWDSLWLAWIFQIIACLSVLQKVFLFTHNDLHSNNIVWRRTEKKFLFYRSKSGTVWKVPTYGRIFSIIDFGRAIYQFKNETFISDDHLPGNYAGDQYNFGPFYNPELPEILPNPSFDLSRLAISLLDGLFDEIPSGKNVKKIKGKGKGKGTQNILHSEPNWTVYETESDLFNLLWSWTIDDRGRTVYVNKDYTERYPGFDLYKVIAAHIHCAVPREQIIRKEFTMFKINSLKEISEDEKIYSIDAADATAAGRAPTNHGIGPT